MSGIMVAVAGNAQNIIYVPGLWVTETSSVQQSPISASISTSSSQTITRNWIGYFLSPSTGAVSLSMQTSASAGSNGGSASTVGRIWLGSNAVAGNNEQADITASGNQIVSANFSLVEGIYYQLRVRWNGTYSGGGFIFSTTSSGGITFLANGSSNVTGRIFYNSITNGF
jgi:hypothetical protein